MSILSKRHEIGCKGTAFILIYQIFCKKCALFSHFRNILLQIKPFFGTTKRFLGRFLRTTPRSEHRLEGNKIEFAIYIVGMIFVV